MASKKFKYLSPFLNLFSDINKIRIMYFYKHATFPKLLAPETFNEKVQWRKLNDRNPLFTTLADKLEVKKYLSGFSSDLFVPKVLWEGECLSGLTTAELPSDYVIKSNNQSGTIRIVRNSAHLCATELLGLEKEWQSIGLDEAFVEWGYSNIPTKYFVEEFLDFDEIVPIDYKFWIFGNKMEFVQVDVGRFTEHTRAFYDLNWKKMEFLMTFPDVKIELEKPANYKEMIQVAEKLSLGLDYARVDLYTDNKKIYFGEITLYPGSGYEKFSPLYFDRTIGELWKISQT